MFFSHCIFLIVYTHIRVYALTMPISKVTMKNAYHLVFQICIHHLFQLPLGRRSHIYWTFYLLIFCISFHTILIIIWSANLLQAHYPTWMTSTTYFSFSHPLFRQKHLYFYFWLLNCVSQLKGRNIWGWRVGRLVVKKKKKKLSNRKRKLGKGNLRSLRGEVAHTHTHTKGTCSTSMIPNYGHSENKRQVRRRPKKKLSSGIHWSPLISIQYDFCIPPTLSTPSLTLSREHQE